MCRVLICDGDESRRNELVERWTGDFSVACAADSDETLALVEAFAPNVLVMDATSVDGAIACCRRAKELSSRWLYAILHAEELPADRRLAAYEAGADDVLESATPSELDHKLRNYFRLMGRFERMAEMDRAESDDRSRTCGDACATVRERISSVCDRTGVICNSVVFALAKLIENRDGSSQRHLERMRGYATAITDELAMHAPYDRVIDAAFREAIHWAAPLHDVGKVAIPEAILLKPARFTDREFEIMKEHCRIGALALEEGLSEADDEYYVQMAIDIARHHHECFDGTGYPDGLSGSDIPLAARIVAVCDVFDALAAERVYKPPMEPSAARLIIRHDSGRRFEPAIVNAFERRFEEFVEIRRTYAQEEASASTSGKASELMR